MILDKNGEVFRVNDQPLEVGDKVLVNTLSGEYETTVIREFFSITLEENNTALKDSACLYAIVKIL